MLTLSCTVLPSMLDGDNDTDEMRRCGAHVGHVGQREEMAFAAIPDCTAVTSCDTRLPL